MAISLRNVIVIAEAQRPKTVLTFLFHKYFRDCLMCLISKREIETARNIILMKFETAEKGHLQQK